MTDMVERKCARCSNPITVRAADVARGWGKFCSKSCKAKKQSEDTGIYGPHYKADGMSVKQMQKGKFAKSKFSGKASRDRWFRSTVAFEMWDDEVINGDAKYSHKHGCWIIRDDGSDPLIDSHPFDMDA